MIRKLLAIGAGCAAALVGGWIAIGPDWRALLAHLPTDRNVLFWSVPQRDAAFRLIGNIPFLTQTHMIERGPVVRPLPQGEPLALDVDLDAAMQEQRIAGLVVLHRGTVRLERYGLGMTAQKPWTSFSVAKSFTATLIGAALADGKIASLDDKVSVYIPEMAGSAYADVSVAQLLSMTSGVAWNEDYGDPNSDVARFDSVPGDPGIDPLVSYMRKLPRAHPPGTVWNYSTGETNLIGVLVARATGVPLSQYLSQKVWQPAGMEADASWILSPAGTEIAGCCIQARTRDFARFGLFVAQGTQVDGRTIVSPDWLQLATTSRISIGRPGKGYGFQWWTSDDGTFEADGIFGQGIFIDRQRDLVVAINSNWTTATGEAGEETARGQLYAAIQRAVDREAASEAASGVSPPPRP